MAGLGGFLGSIIGSALFGGNDGDPLNNLEKVLTSLIDNGIGTRSQLLNMVLSAEDSMLGNIIEARVTGDTGMSLLGELLT